MSRAAFQLPKTFVFGAIKPGYLGAYADLRLWDFFDDCISKINGDIWNGLITGLTG